MFKPLKRPNCKFIGGEAAFIGKTGLIVDKIDKHFRIILDEPVDGRTEGQWLPREVALIRPPKGWAAPVGFELAMSAMPPLPAQKAAAPANPAAVVSDAPAIEERTETRLAEAVLAESAQLEAEQAAPEGQQGEGEGLDLDQYLADREAQQEALEGQQGQPDTTMLDTAIEAVGGKRRKGKKDGKPKALSAKAKGKKKS
jgi:type IV secretory pathway VirB10-like protein